MFLSYTLMLSRSGNDATSGFFFCCCQRFEGKFGNNGGSEDVNNEGMGGNGRSMHRDGWRVSGESGANT